MELEKLEQLVRQVMSEMNVGSSANVADAGVFADMETAISQAAQAQRTVANLSMADREKIIANIRKKTVENAEKFAQMAVSETGMGSVPHKIAKHQLVANKTPGTEDITTTAFSGDRGLTLIERGPFGVIGAITPCTNPSETVICNTIGMLAAGNTAVFNPHPAAVETSNFAVRMLNQASVEVGGPENIAVSTLNPTIESSGILFKHPSVQLLAITGGPGVVTAALKSGKRAIGAGAGNPPVLVDETADIKQAAIDIINGATFDNNLPCIAEKEVVAVAKIADELTYYMERNGCYKANAADIDKIVATVLDLKDGRYSLSRNCVGKSAAELLRMSGISADKDVRCIIFDGDCEHILVKEELMMPILGIVRVRDVDEGIRIATALEHGYRHSAHMHSKNVDNLTRFGKAVDTAIFVKNAPSYAALGFGGEGFCSFTIASRTGEGLTSASTFTKSRRCVMSDSLCIR